MQVVAPLKALCKMLQSQIDSRVILGVPDSTTQGIFVWPWQLYEDPKLRNIPPRKESDTSPLQKSSGCAINFLVLVRPDLTAESLSKLEAAHQAIIDNPVLEVEGHRVAISLLNLDSETLTSLFIAASIPLSICLSARLENTIKI
jgi:hypothetical protein